MEWIWNQIHSSPKYFRLSFVLVWLNTCLRGYSFALDPIRGDFGSSLSRSLAWREFRGIWVDLLYAADDVRTRREWEREIVASGAIQDFLSEEF